MCDDAPTRAASDAMSHAELPPPIVSTRLPRSWSGVL